MSLAEVRARLLVGENRKEVALARPSDPGAHDLLGGGEKKEHVRRRRAGKEGEKEFPRLDPVSPKSPTGHGAPRHTATLWKQTTQASSLAPCWSRGGEL